MLQKINRGDVYFYNFGFEYDGSIEGKNRPCVIISNDKGNNYGTTALVAPITTRSKESCKPWQVHYINGNKSQIILCEQIKTVNISKLYNYQGRLDALTMRAVDEALAIEFDLNVTQKEQNATEFLHRLDNVLDTIISKRMISFENKLNDVISTAIAETHNTKHDYEELEQLIRNLLNEKSNNDILDNINEIKLLFNKNADNLDKILSTLINLYKNLNNSNEININSNTEKVESKLITDDNEAEKLDNNVPKKEIIRKPKYTLDDAKTMVEDYYNMERSEFMSKYSLKDRVMCNNRLTTMKSILKKNGIDYKNIKNNVKVYNINDLSEEERRANFATYLKRNKTLSVVNTYKPSKTIEKAKVSKSNRNAKWQPKIEYDNVDLLLSFIEECNNNTVAYICDKYGLTRKQLSNRKYLITKSLKERNIPVTIIKKSRKDV